MAVITHALETNAVRSCSLSQARVCARQNQPSNFASLRSTEISCDLTSNPPKYKANIEDCTKPT